MGRAAGVEDREERTPFFSMRVKAAAAGIIFLVGMVVLAIPGMPYLVAAIDGILYGSEHPRDPLVIGYGWLMGAEMSPTGSLLATVSESAIHVWFTNGTLLSSLHAVGAIPWSGFGWSPDGKMIAALDYLGNVTVANIPGLSIVKRWWKTPCYDLAIMNPADIWGIDMWPVKWSPNGSLVAFGYCDARTHILNVSSDEYIELGSNPNLPHTFEWVDVRAIDWDQSGGRLIRTARKSFVVHDMHTLEPLYEISKEGLPWGNESAAFSPDGQRIAATRKRTSGLGKAPYHLDVYNSTQGELLATVNISIKPMDLAWSPDGDLVVIGDEAGDLVFYHSDDLAIENNVSAHTGPVSSLSWRGGYLVSASDDQTVKLWMLNQFGGPVLVRSFLGWGSGVSWVEFASNDAVLAGYVAHGDSIRLHKSSGSSAVFLPYDRLLGDFASVALSPDRKRIATITTMGFFSSWDARHGTLETRWDIDPHDGVVEWNPFDSSMIAIGGPDGVEIWDLDRGGEGPTTSLRVGEVRCMAWSPDGNRIAIGMPSRIEIWDPKVPRLLSSATTWKLLYSIEWSPDSSMLASLAGFDPWWGYNPEGSEYPCTARGLAAMLEIWDTAETTSGGNLSLVDSRAAVRHYESSPNCVAWAPNSTMIAVAAGCPGHFAGVELGRECGFMEPGVMLYNVHREAGLVSTQNMTGPMRFVSSVDWSEDGSRIAAGSMDGTIWVWYVGPQGLPKEIGDPAIYLGATLGAVILIEVLRKRNDI